MAEPGKAAPTFVMVTICTRDRPILLDACLASVCAQAVPEGVRLEIAVIENNDRLTCEPILAKHRAASGLAIHGVPEPELGIPFTRNRCGTFAAEQGADWLLYIDDDETAQPGWLARMVEASRTYDADVLYGRVMAVYPSGTPAWMQVKERNKRPNGTALSKAEGHNTLVRTKLFAADGMNLRFDTALRFTGGSDTDFFSRAHQAGAKIIWVGDAIVDEIVPASRMTLGWQLNRTFRVAISISVLHEKQRGRASAVLRSVSKGTGRILEGIVRAPLGLVAIVSPEAGKKLAFKAAKQFYSGLGSFAYIAGVRPQPYRKVDGG